MLALQESARNGTPIDLVSHTNRYSLVRNNTDTPTTGEYIGRLVDHFCLLSFDLCVKRGLIGGAVSVGALGWFKSTMERYKVILNLAKASSYFLLRSTNV